MADGLAMDPPQAPKVDLEAAAPPLLRRRLVAGTEERVLIDPEKVSTTRYRYRGAIIPSPWPATDEDTTTAA